MRNKLLKIFHPISNKNIFILISIGLLFWMLFQSKDAGNSGDEHYNLEQSEYVFNYFKSAGKDLSAVDTELPMQKYYGQSFDNLVYFVERWFGFEDSYLLRHFFNSLTGWLLILFSGLTASLLFGWRAGLITLLLMFLSPRVLGHSWNNPKDIPFAMTYLFTIYFILKLIKQIPKPKTWTFLLLIIGIAGSISIRIGGLLLVPYLFLFTGLFYLLQKDFYNKASFLKAIKIFLLLALVSIIGYFMGLILWPYGLQNPLKNPMVALKAYTNFSVSLRQLFEGKTIFSQNLPWYYGIKYILITTPIVVFVGLGAFFVSLPFRKEPKNNYLFYSFLVFAFIFPVFYTIYKSSNLYGGWRHLLFTYSPIAILAAGGFEFLLSRKNKYLRYISLGVLILLFIHPLKHIIKNHPYEYVYFNELVGGVNGAYGKYEMDYYYHSLKIACDWFIKEELGDDTVTVATNHGAIAEYAFRNNPNVKTIYSRYYEKNTHDWDYAIFVNTHISPFQLKHNLWPPAGTIHTENVDSVPIAAVIKRVSDENYKGFQALKKSKVDEAQQHFENYLKLDNKNEEVLNGMARVYLMRRNFKKALEYANKSLNYYPRYLGALFTRTVALNSTKDFKNALVASDKVLERKRNFAEGYYQRAFALYNLGKPNDALKELQKATSHKKKYYEAFMLTGDILMNYQQYKKAAKNIYKKVLSFRKNDIRATLKLAECYHFQKNNNEAEKILAEVQKKNRRSFEAAKLACRIAIDKGQQERARQYLYFMRKVSANADLYVIKALYELKANNKTAAKTYLEKAIKLDKKNNEAKRLLKSFTQKPVKESIMVKKEQPKKRINFLNPIRRR